MSDPQNQNTAVSLLEAWISEEGILTGARFVDHIEYDPNWKGAFKVVLKEWIGKKQKRYVGEGPNKPGGLEIAIENALKEARRCT